MNETTCAILCDEIIHTLELDAAIDALRLAAIDDPTYSSHAAHIRDAIRDNFDDADLDEYA